LSRNPFHVTFFGSLAMLGHSQKGGHFMKNLTMWSDSSDDINDRWNNGGWNDEYSCMKYRYIKYLSNIVSILSSIIHYFNRFRIKLQFSKSKWYLLCYKSFFQLHKTIDLFTLWIFVSAPTHISEVMGHALKTRTSC
jgi:hypothetical protein